MKRFVLCALCAALLFCGAASCKNIFPGSPASRIKPGMYRTLD